MMSTYGILMLIVLVNLLIAIMNDTYDRIKETEEIEVLHNRARLIVDLESLLTRGMREKLQVRVRGGVCRGVAGLGLQRTNWT